MWVGGRLIKLYIAQSSNPVCHMEECCYHKMVKSEHSTDCTSSWLSPPCHFSLSDLIAPGCPPPVLALSVEIGGGVAQWPRTTFMGRVTWEVSTEIWGGGTAHPSTLLDLVMQLVLMTGPASMRHSVHRRSKPCMTSVGGIHITIFSVSRSFCTTRICHLYLHIAHNADYQMGSFLPLTDITKCY